MWIIRIWLIILAALSVSALALLSLTAVPWDRDTARTEGYRLDLIQHNVHLLLRLDQREHVDVAARLSRAPRIVNALTDLSLGKAGIDEVRGITQAALLEMLGQIPSNSRPTLGIVVDQTGLQVSRIDSSQQRLKPSAYGLSGFPLVSEALRGLLRDDTWSVDGKLYLMAAAPIVAHRAAGEISRNSPKSNPYVGALIIGQEVNASYVERLKQRLGAANIPAQARTDIAFFLRGSALAATMAIKPLEKLPLRFVKYRSEYIRAGRSAALHIESTTSSPKASTPPSSHLVIIAPLPGEAAEHDAFYAVVTEIPPPSGMLEQLSRLRLSDASDMSFWLRWGVLFLILVVLGNGLLVLKIDQPLRRLLADLRRLSHSELNRLPLHQYGGGFKLAGQLVNDSIDRMSKRNVGRSVPGMPPQSPSRRGTREDMLGGIPVESTQPNLSGGGLPPNLGAADRHVSAAPSSSTGMPPLARLDEPALSPAARPLSPSPNAVSPSPNAASSRLAAQTPAVVLDPEIITPAVPYRPSEEVMSDPSQTPPRSTRGMPRTAGSNFDAELLKPINLPAGEDEDPYEARDSYEASTTVTSGFSGLSSSQLQGPLERPSVETIALGDSIAMPSRGLAEELVEGALVGEESETVMSSVPLHLARSIKGRTPSPAPTQLNVRSAEQAAFNEHIEQVYQEFLAAKHRCGEPTESLTFDRFATKLRKNRETLMTKYDCQDVRFKVYVKEGKAALKATPI